jgi:hypothetical protein
MVAAKLRWPRGRRLPGQRLLWEGANDAKVSAEKVAKPADTKAKKSEKALADADQKQIQREQSIAARLDMISATVGSKCRVVLFWLLTQACIADICLLSLVCFFVVQ